MRNLVDHVSSGVGVYEVRDNGNDFIIKEINQAAERIDRIKKEDVIGKSLMEVFPGGKEFGLVDALKRVWESGNPEELPEAFYSDGRISGWRKNYIYKLKSAELVVIYDDLTQKREQEHNYHERRSIHL